MKRALRWTGRAGAGLALAALLAPALLSLSAPPARAAPPAAGNGHTVAHVVIVGIPGLRWTFASAASTPALWRLAGEGSVGSLVDYAEQPLACPDDGWLTLNGGARAQGPRPCPALPAVRPAGGGARVPAMAQIVAYNRQFHENPDWGLLASLASCATAVGPGAALALATPSGAVSAYLPSPSDITAAVLARCPLTVIDLGAITVPERASAAAADHVLARIVAGLPPDTMLLVAAPGAALADGPHLRSVVVSGPGFSGGLLDSASTRQPGIVTITDLTPTVAGWLGRHVPPGISGAMLTSVPRGPLAAAIRALVGRDTAEQVWISTHGWFFIGYALADALVLGVPALLCWGAGPGRARRRASWWRTAGVFAAAVPAGTFLANLVPWWLHAHPAAWLYGIAVAWALAVGAAALAGPWRRDALGPYGAICLFTLAVLGIDVMTGSRLQLETPFGLSLIEGGRFYGIGNEALGVYCACALTGAAWLGLLAARRFPARRWPAVLAASAVGLFAVVAAGWPGFGAKVGATIALVPCLVVLVLAIAGRGVSRRWAAPVAVSGLLVFAAFAVVSYFFPAAGISDIGAFAGNLLHGRGGALLERKVSSNVDTLTVSVFSWLIPVTAVAAWAALWRPAALRLRTLNRAFAAEPLLRTLAWLIWLVLVIGWFADDSGVIVPAAALPFALPLVICMAASASGRVGAARYVGTAFAGSSVAGQTPRLGRGRLSAVPAFASRDRPVPARDRKAEGRRP
ncbi:hypothetical protein [Trebonia sp.]|uniref:hypothetical protein n=1 Tax=Trebonia sp. TaxID=2767075 RepID=UPI0026049513|nr:hypothetical protein [Trebonia sp.]